MRLVAALLSAIVLSPVAVGQELPSSYPPPDERGTYYLSIHPADSAAYPSPYPNPKVRDSIDAQHEDHFAAARAIERHMLTEQDIGFLEPIQRGDPHWAEHSKRWKITLVSGEIIWTDLKPLNVRFAHFMFEYFYAAHELILFRVLHGKQVGFALVSRESGQIVEAFGPPLFSPSGQWFATFHDDSMAGWSPNGLQVFKVDETEMGKVIEYDMGRRAPGPTALEWTGEESFRLEMHDEDVGREGEIMKYRHFEVDIQKTTE
jgi:hypothetical protein